MSHHATEDLAILRALPNITVLAPCTEKEAIEATKSLISNRGVGYLRLDKSSADDSRIKSTFKIGKSRRYLEGKDLTLIATGGILEDANNAALKLKKHGINSRVVGMHTIKPIDKNEIIDAAQNTGGIITIEEHNKDGGLGSAVCEVCMDNKVMPKKFLRVGLDNIYSSIVGSQKHLKKEYEMDCEAIVQKALELLN